MLACFDAQPSTPLVQALHLFLRLVVSGEQFQKRFLIVERPARDAFLNFFRNFGQTRDQLVCQGSTWLREVLAHRVFLHFVQVSEVAADALQCGFWIRFECGKASNNKLCGRHFLSFDDGGCGRGVRRTRWVC